MSVLFYVLMVIWALDAVRLLFGPRCQDCLLLMPVSTWLRGARWMRTHVAPRRRGWLCPNCFAARMKPIAGEIIR